MAQQLRSAALSVHLNIAEGSPRKSETDRRRFYEISRGSVIEIDTILDDSIGLEYFSIDEIKNLGETLLKNLSNAFQNDCLPTSNT